ncbi:hypothetical protein CENSYa_1855 [Cenarchaeum symbiosum A]|uniref:Uncharacterized protein n=1 Tax=Cenarchaeum symbiosum (strain A) TaxID=414004 RepID=A0RYP8_CENSY|nr:hypothetical protein CENSYa_1855 [Cenarchaeum symbiosum A]
MSHIDVDVIDFLLLTIYPAAGLLAVEAAYRAARFPLWVKLLAQAAVSTGFAVAYVTLITAHWLTSIVLLFLAAALLYQARRAKIDPAKSVY